MRARVALGTCALVLGACRSAAPADPVNEAGVSPQAIAEPAPLANGPLAMSDQPLASDAGPPPVPLRGDEPAPPDPIAKDAPGWELEASMHPIDPPPAFRGPETAITAIDALKRKNEPRLVIDFTPTRARLVLASGAFVLPADTELRARADRYGFFLSLPDTSQYRVVAPGALRAVFDDRRVDVAPLASADVIARGEAGRRLGYRTRRVEVKNRVGTAAFEIAHVADVGEGGMILCRFLVELMNAPEATPVCTTDDVPLHVELRWPNKMAFAFEATALAHRADLGAASMQAPPAGASFTLPALPFTTAEGVASLGEVAAFRTAPADVPEAPNVDGGPTPPSSGLALGNASDQLRFAWLDGVPVAWVAPGGRLVLGSLLRGRYGFAWRSFLSDSIDPPITITVPAFVVAGAGDAGAP